MTPVRTCNWRVGSTGRDLCLPFSRQTSWRKCLLWFYEWRSDRDKLDSLYSNILGLINHLFLYSLNDFNLIMNSLFSDDNLLKFQAWIPKIIWSKCTIKLSYSAALHGKLADQCPSVPVLYLYLWLNLYKSCQNLQLMGWLHTGGFFAASFA